MAAKTVQVSVDSGSTWNTLPGHSGAFNRTKNTVDDTIFGYDYQSQQPDLASWQLTANAYYKGFAGYQASILQSGTSTSFTGQSMSNTTGQTYRIDSASMEVWDRSVTPTINDNGTPVVASNIASINYLFGEVTFASGYTVTGPVTADGSYFPMAALAKANSFTLKQSAAQIDTTDFGTASSNGGWKTSDPGLRTVTLDLSGIFDSTANMHTALVSASEIIIEIGPTGSSTESKARGFFRINKDDQQGDVGALEQQSLSFALTVPQGPEFPFAWDHPSTTTLSTAVQNVLDSFTGGTKPMVQYLYDGTAGWNGTAIVSDVSLSGGVSAMNEFSVTFDGDGAPTVV